MAHSLAGRRSHPASFVLFTAAAGASGGGVGEENALFAALEMEATEALATVDGCEIKSISHHLGSPGFGWFPCTCQQTMVSMVSEWCEMDFVHPLQWSNRELSDAKDLTFQPHGKSYPWSFEGQSINQHTNRRTRWLLDCTPLQ